MITSCKTKFKQEKDWIRQHAPFFLPIIGVILTIVFGSWTIITASTTCGETSGFGIPLMFFVVFSLIGLFSVVRLALDHRAMVHTGRVDVSTSNYTGVVREDDVL